MTQWGLLVEGHSAFLNQAMEEQGRLWDMVFASVRLMGRQVGWGSSGDR